METTDIISDTINDNQMELSEQITTTATDMELLEKEKEHNENIESSVVSPVLQDTENSKEIIERTNEGSVDTLKEGTNVEADQDNILLPESDNTAMSMALNCNKITRPCQFAVHRIKTIMKCDPALALASKESVFAIAKATEFFVELLSKEAYKFTSQGNRKTLQKKDIDLSVNSVDSLCFLDAALD